MSHFTVLVIGENAEKQLAPYQENNMGDCPKQYLAFLDEEDEYRKSYAVDKTHQVECLATAETDSLFSERCRNPNYNFADLNAQKYVAPEGWVEKEVPVNEVYPTFDEYMENYCGYDKGRDEVMNRYGRWKNPNAKWDWYVLGGRWPGFFDTKDGRKVESEFIKNIDFEKKMKENRLHGGLVYDLVWNAIKDTPPLIPWTTIMAEEDDKSPGGGYDKAREIFHNQPRNVALAALNEKLRKKERYSLSKAEREIMWFEDLEKFNYMNREQYAAYRGEKSIQTFAVVKDGKWYERGKMGWWAIVSDSKDDETWASMYQGLLRNLPDDTLVSVYDCHI